MGDQSNNSDIVLHLYGRPGLSMVVGASVFPATSCKFLTQLIANKFRFRNHTFHALRSTHNSDVELIPDNDDFFQFLFKRISLNYFSINGTRYQTSNEVGELLDYMRKYYVPRQGWTDVSINIDTHSISNISTLTGILGDPRLISTTTTSREKYEETMAILLSGLSAKHKFVIKFAELCIKDIKDVNEMWKSGDCSIRYVSLENSRGTREAESDGNFFVRDSDEAKLKLTHLGNGYRYEQV